MDPELYLGSRSRIIVPDPIPPNMKEQINKNVISLCILDFVYCRTLV